MHAAHTLAEMAARLNRPPGFVAELQQRFALPMYEGQAYSDAYLAFLRTVVFLRCFGISEERLLQLWSFEKRLLQFLHVDTTGSETWFLDCCGNITRRERRLLLTNFDLGASIPSQTVQLGLNFADALPEIFSSGEGAEDGVRLLKDCILLGNDIRAEVAAELPLLREAATWAGRLPKL